MCWPLFQSLDLISNFTLTAAIQRIIHILHSWSDLWKLNTISFIWRKYHVTCFQSNDDFKMHRKWLWSWRKDKTMWIWDWKRQMKYFEQIQHLLVMINCYMALLNWTKLVRLAVAFGKSSFSQLLRKKNKFFPSCLLSVTKNLSGKESNTKVWNNRRVTVTKIYYLF